MSLKNKKSNIWIGTSGYNYDHWQSVFYPENLAQKKWLEFYTKHFKTVELNVTFYRLPQESAFHGWHCRTPKDFLFVCKGSRFISHIKKLRGVKQAVDLFFARAKLLKEKLKVVLWQFPPNFKLKQKTKDQKSKIQIKNKKIEKLKMFENFLRLLKKYKIRQAFEFRDESWFCEEIFYLLKKYNYALVLADSPRYPLAEKITADFVYVRFHGSKALFSSNYTKSELQNWAKKIKKWQKQKLDIYCYFNNDAQGYAVKNAKELARILNV
ncbi:MAG: DUF72 domain-containing protein [Patescibacteria group bacterium]